jgi:amino acid transporter
MVIHPSTTNSRGSICFAHIRFRKAWVVQGNSVDDLPFKAAAGVWGSWLGLFLNIICLIAQFYIALFPIGGQPNAASFFQAYLAAPIVLVFYIGWKIWHRTRFVKAHEVDLISGRRDMNLAELRAQELEERTHWSKSKK